MAYEERYILVVVSTHTQSPIQHSCSLYSAPFDLELISLAQWPLTHYKEVNSVSQSALRRLGSVVE